MKSFNRVLTGSGLFRSVFLFVSCLPMLVAVGCDGCGCGARPALPPSPGVSAESGSPADPGVSTASGRATRPEVVAKLGDLVPYDAKWVAVFELDRLAGALHKVARNAPKVVRARDYHDIRSRILELYGIDMDLVKGPCLMAGLRTGGVFLTCDSGTGVVEPQDAARWSVGDWGGPVILRRGTLISTGTVGRRLVAGEQNAVFFSLTNHLNGQPDLGAVFSRKNCIAYDLAADDAWHDFAFFYLKEKPAWCPDDICRGAAVFGGGSGFKAVAIASDLDKIDLLRNVVESAWSDTVARWQAVKDRGGQPAELFVDSGMPLQENGVTSRADRVVLSAAGDIFDFMSVIMLDDIDQVLGR